jgi:serine/threonine protein kinase
MSTDSRVGTDLGGYPLESLLGRGGMSVVYLATDRRLKRKVALKVMGSEIGPGPGEVAVDQRADWISR